MKILSQEVVPQADAKLIEGMQTEIATLSPVGRKKLLTSLARTCLAAESSDICLADEDGDVFAYLYPTKRPPLNLFAGFTKKELAAIEKNFFDPKYLFSLEEMLAQISAEHDQISPAKQVQAVAGQVALPSGNP